MSMPNKGKYAHHSHHTQLQNQHILSANQASNSGLSQPPHVQQYSSAILNSNAVRFMANQEYHVSGQAYNTQPAGQLGTSGVSVSVINDRNHPINAIPSLISPSNLTGIAANNPAQTTACSNIQSHQLQGSASTTTAIHNSSSSEMNKQTHLQGQPSSMQQIYPGNPNRSSQNYYASGHRNQSSRNVNQRNIQTSNQNQVVNMSGVNSGNQPTALYQHSPIAIQAPAMYVPQGQVPNIHSGTPQQNVYTMANQITMQFAGPPARHQTQNQFSYGSYPSNTLVTTPHFLGYAAGAQHPSVFYHQTPPAQLNFGRTNTNTVNTSSQQLSGGVSGNQGAPLLSTGNSLPPSVSQQSFHPLNVSLPQSDGYPSYSGGMSNVSGRTKKTRSNAIIDIVNPNTGQNISAEIYEDDTSSRDTETSEKDASKKTSCGAEFVVAEFAAQVAKLASDSASDVPKKDSKSDNVDEISSSSENIPGFDGKDQSNLPQEAINVEKEDASLIANPISVDDEGSTIKITENPESLNTTDQETENVTSTSASDSCTIHEESAIIDNIDPIESIDKKSQNQVICDDIIPNEAENEMCGVEGIIMQKQKNRNKTKNREVNRRSMEKEKSDMDIPSNTNNSNINIQPKEETNPDNVIDKNNVLKEEQLEDQNSCKLNDPESSDKSTIIDNVAIEESHTDTMSQDNDKKENKKDDVPSSLLIEDVVDHVHQKSEQFLEEKLSSMRISQKNDENIDVSEINDTDNTEVPSDENADTKKSEGQGIPTLKYSYHEDQWSPINTQGKKVYGREFLMKLQQDPCCHVKPTNLPDLDVVLKENSKNRIMSDQRYKESNIGRHESLFPGFVKSSLSSKMLPLNKKNHLGKPKAAKPSLIHVSLSLREDVKLRETENAWKPTRLVSTSNSDEQNKTDALYKRVRSVLNKLTPQKFDTLINQVRDLHIDTQERLQGVINLVFEKAIDEPNFSVAYALMCKELSNINVSGSNSEDSSSTNFRKLILTRCQSEFEKNTVEENARSDKLKMIEDCTDPEKKKELQLSLEEEERRMRIKSVGNIRFIGELFKQNMLTCKIMIQCIRHLLKQADEENLECLCKLLTTIGKALEMKNTDLSEYFKQMQQIAHSKGKVSSRIRFMLQDVIDLRNNKWVPRRNDSNPKTMDQIQKEADSERMDMQLNSMPSNTPRKEERPAERKRNRGGVSVEDGWSQPVGRTRPQIYSIESAKLKNKLPSVDDMQLGNRSHYQWSQASKISTPNKFSYLENVETDRRMPNIPLPGSRSTGSRDYNRIEYKSSFDSRTTRNSSYQLSSGSKESSSAETTRSQSLTTKPPITSSQSLNAPISVSSSVPAESNKQIPFEKSFERYFEEYIASEETVEEAAGEFKGAFPVSTHAEFVQELINSVLEKSDLYRNKVSKLFAQLLSQKLIDKDNFKAGLNEIVSASGDLIIDIPKLWTYIAMLLVQSIANGSLCFNDLKSFVEAIPSKLRSDGYASTFFAELMKQLLDIKDSSWIINNWTESSLKKEDFDINSERMDLLLKKYNLGFLILPMQNDNPLMNAEKIHQKLLDLMKNPNFDEICDWIKVDLNTNSKHPKFIRLLMTAILESVTYKEGLEWNLKIETFDILQKLIHRYVDADESLELQCLFAVQSFVHKLQHPSGLMNKLFTYLFEGNILSNEAFLNWEENEEPAERDGKVIALMSLKSFFAILKESGDLSEEEP
uniref:MI domain-containing protein n=1 Tax=Trichogramma kaykai TaxID=54128 RepID=A0ABD2X3F2_9HYME